MTNILLRCVNHFGYLPRIVVFNENQKLINFAIQYHAKPIVVLTRNSSQLKQSYKVMIQEKIDDINDQMLKHNWIKRKELEDVVDLIQVPYYINNGQVLSLLQWCNNVIDCSPLDKVKLMESIWFTLTTCNFQLIIYHYNAILAVYVENNYDFSLDDLLTEMKSHKIYPDYNTYNICMKYYCTRGKFKEAISLWADYSKTFPLYSSENLFNSLLAAYSQLGNVEYVNKIMNNMINNNIKPTTESYASIMCVYAKLNDIDKIQNTIQTCHLNNIYFTNVHILEVIYTLAANNHLEHINIMYQYLNKVLFISNKEIQCILKLINIDQIDTALNVFLLMSLKENENMEIILKYVVDKSMKPDKVIQICNWFKNNTKLYKKLLLLSLYYSLPKDDKLSLSLLKICKDHCTIKPHYFWPLFKNKANQYDFQGILNILEIMMNEFNISPCVDTITNYVLPICFGDVHYTRNVLLKHKVSETVINNAWVLLFLKKTQSIKAAAYIQTYPGQYSYKILAHDLRNATVARNDIENFINISYNLSEDEENIKHSTTVHNDTYKLAPVPLERQIYDLMIDYPSNKVWFKRIIDRLESRNVKLNHETIRKINSFLKGHTARDVNVSTYSRNHIEHADKIITNLIR